MDDTPRRPDGRDGRRLAWPGRQGYVAQAHNGMARALERWLGERRIEELRDLPLFDTRAAIEARDPSVWRPWWAWAERHHIAAPCVVWWAYAVTRAWQRTGQRPTFPVPILFGAAAFLAEGVVVKGPGSYRGTPPPADPLHQSRDEYLQEAGRVWDRAAALLRRRGYRPVSPTSQVAAHCAWVVRHRALGEPHAVLSTDAELDDPGTIARGIRRIEVAVGMAAWPPSDAAPTPRHKKRLSGPS